MKALVYREYGAPDVLALAEVERPTPKDDEVLVRVHAASVNSWDWDLLRGQPWLTRIGGWRAPKHPILGCDVAGTVEAVGRRAPTFAVGDEVFGDLSGGGWGGFAPWVCAKDGELARKPTSVTFEDAAALPQAGVLALQGLRQGEGDGRAREVLLNGAGGGVGTIALQIAKHRGARVTCVDAPDKLPMLQSLGADAVIDYTRDDFTHGDIRYDVILDVVGRAAISSLLRALAPKGAYVMVGGPMSNILRTAALGLPIRWLTGKRLGLLIHRPNRGDLETLAQLCEAGVVTPVIDRQCALSEVPQALADLGAGRVQGKLVVTLGG
jgi:NADPH:quinone reductase-like Zn-dependent oxidoreductase